jgi:hypothetical protein
MWPLHQCEAGCSVPFIKRPQRTPEVVPSSAYEFMWPGAGEWGLQVAEGMCNLHHGDWGPGPCCRHLAQRSLHELHLLR